MNSFASWLPFQNEVSVKEKNKALESSTAAFVEEVLEDLQHATSTNSLPIYLGIISALFFCILH